MSAPATTIQRGLRHGSAAAARHLSTSLSSGARTQQRRSLSKQCVRITTQKQQQQQQRRWQSSDAAASAEEVAVSPKIASIVDQISTLTLLETADLVKSLKSRLNIPDISFAAPAAGGAAGGAAPAAAEDDEPAAAAPAEKTLFNLKLESFEATAKPKIIKEVKGLLGLSLVDSKKFVEAAPKVLKEGLTKEEAEKIKAAIEGLGGKVTIE